MPVSLSEKSALIQGLKHSPLLLRELLGQISYEERKLHRIPDKWSIHEHACHLAQAEIMIYDRFQTFKFEPKPEFHPYLPGTTVADDELIHLDFDEQLDSFTLQRSKTVELLESFEDSIWEKAAIHPQYSQYSTHILLRHTLMHDHFHMYRIEELWLTRSDYL